MIAAPNEYFLAEEAKKVGSRPVFRFTFYPHYFDHGIGAGQGTFDDCSFVAPERLQVDEEVGDASWISADLEETDMNYPLSVTITWESDHPGYEEAVYLKTASTQAALAAASWVELTSGNAYDLYKWHKIKVEWIIVRSWATDSEEMEPWQAYAIDAPPDDYESYAVDGLESDAAYIEMVRLAGEMGLDVRDVLDGGTVTCQMGETFGDLAAGDHVLTLFNRDNKFDYLDPANFIFKGTLPWVGKKLRIQFGYERPGWKDLADLITVYEGRVYHWGRPYRRAGNVEAVEVSSRDFLGELLRKPLGLPADDGSPSPRVYGEVLLEARAMGDEHPESPLKTVDLETGDLSQFDQTYTGGDGALSVITTTPKTGVYCGRSSVLSADSYAYGRLELAADSSEVLLTADLRFATLPASPVEKVHRFLGLETAAGVEIFGLYHGEDYKVWGYYPGTATWTQIDVNLAAYEDAWNRWAIGAVGGANGNLQVRFNGDEVMSLGLGTYSWAIRQGYVGLRLGAVFNEYVMDFDNVRIWPSCYLQMFQLPGGAYQEIKEVYTDGEVRYRSRKSQGRVGISVVDPVKVFSGGRLNDTCTVYPAWGAVNFPDLSNQVSGTVMVKARKNDLTHQADIIEDLITTVEMEDLINAASFAAAKAAVPDDAIGGNFEKTTLGDALGEIAKKCLMDFYQDQGQFFLQAYTGAAPSGPVMDLSDFNLKEIAGGCDQEGLVNKIISTYGWHERNADLSYTVADSQYVGLLGENPEEINWEWGESVATELYEMVKAKADWRLQRGKGGIDGGELVADLTAARLELGDVVSHRGVNYRVFKKALEVKNRETALVLKRFLGEE